MTTWRWIDTITTQLELCDAVAGETAVVLGVDTGDKELRDLVAISLERLGCRVSELIVRSGALLDAGDPVDNEAVAAALLHSDLVVDLGGDLVERSMARDEILDEARVLAIDIESTGELDYLVAHPGLAKRLARAVALVEPASRLSISSAAGTSLELDLVGTDVVALSGVASAVGDIAHWPTGIVWVETGDAELTGSLVVMPGDLMAEAAHVMRSPVRVDVRKGRMVEVLGETADADVLRSYLEGFNDESAYRVSGVGWGMNLTRRLLELGIFDPSHLTTGRGPLAAGRVNIRTGAHDGVGGVTLSLARGSVAVDDSQMVLDGQLESALEPDIYERAAGH